MKKTLSGLITIGFLLATSVHTSILASEFKNNDGDLLATTAKSTYVSNEEMIAEILNALVLNSYNDKLKHKESEMEAYSSEVYQKYSMPIAWITMAFVKAKNTRENRSIQNTTMNLADAIKAHLENNPCNIPGVHSAIKHPLVIRHIGILHSHKKSLPKQITEEELLSTPLNLDYTDAEISLAQTMMEINNVEQSMLQALDKDFFEHVFSYIKKQNIEILRSNFSQEEMQSLNAILNESNLRQILKETKYSTTNF